MIKTNWRRVELVLGFGVALVGCGGAAGGNGPPPTGPDITDGPAFFPLAIGDSWSYRISTPDGTMADKVTTVEAMEPEDGANGPLAFRIRNQALDGTNINWEQMSGGAIVRYRQNTLDAADGLLVDKTYAPSSLEFDASDAHLVPGVTWNETYLETQSSATATAVTKQEFVKWTLEATDDVVSVPAGTFTCIRVRRHHSSSKNPADEVAWYARGTGKIKETGAGTLADQTRELISASLP